MYTGTITFQLPTHYLSKVAVKLEYLYLSVKQASQENHPSIHHHALNNIIEMLTLIEKPELKSRFLKELMRIEHVLNRLSWVDSKNLQENLHHHIQFLSHVVGRFGGEIHQEAFIQSIKAMQTTQHNDFEMYSPQLLLWLASTSSLRRENLILWLNHLEVLYSTVSLYLTLLRTTAQFNPIDMRNGFYQCSLPPKHHCHLILLRMGKKGIVPQIQLGHHGLSLRLCDLATMREIKETNITFDLAVCQL